MGNFCNTDIYKQIKEKYPTQLSQYIGGEQIKNALTNKVDQVKTKVSAGVDDLQKSNLATIDSKQNQIKSQFQTAKQQIDQNYLGGLKGLEQTKNAKIEDILGFTAAQQKLQGIRTDLTNKFKDEKAKVTANLDAIKNQNVSKVENNQPRIPEFEQLPDAVKKTVFQSGLSDFKDQIENQAKNFLAPLQEKLKPENFMSRFTNLLPIDSLKSIANVSKLDMSKQVQSLIGNPSEGKVFLG